MAEPIRIGTRASLLARTQSAVVGDALAEEREGGLAAGPLLARGEQLLARELEQLRRVLVRIDESAGVDI